MQGRKKIVVACALACVVAAAGAGLIALNFKKNSDQLWQIVSQQCIPQQQQHQRPDPCRQVDISAGYAILKDRNGPLQFLLIPVTRISGIESQILLNPFTPNFFGDAWRARHFMAMLHGKPIDDRVYSLAINSMRDRTQNQLHIHISCLRPEIRQRLDELAPGLNSQWQTQPLGKQDYQLRVVTRDELKRTSPFMRIAAELPGARQEMGRYGIAIAALKDGRKVLMVVKRNWWLLERGYAEELQDHSCALLNSGALAD